MTTRNFMQQGQAYGTTTCTITATLDGVEIYSGPAPTEEVPMPPFPGPDIEFNAFGWQLPVSYQGGKTLTITVQGSPFVLADTLADRNSPSNVNALTSLYFSQTISGVQVDDPLTAVTIDGVSRERATDLPGQWYWTVLPGETFQATLNILAGIDYADWDPTLSYTTYSNVVYQGQCYSNGKTPAAPGTVPSTNPATWYTLPIALWDDSIPYAQWTRVSDNSNPSQPLVYMALQSVPAGTPLSDTVYWQLRSGT